MVCVGFQIKSELQTPDAVDCQRECGDLEQSDRMLIKDRSLTSFMFVLHHKICGYSVFMAGERQIH